MHSLRQGLLSSSIISQQIFVLIETCYRVALFLWANVKPARKEYGGKILAAPHPDGLTAPMHNARENAFRKSVMSALQQPPEIMEEVTRLINADDTADAFIYYVRFCFENVILLESIFLFANFCRVECIHILPIIVVIARFILSNLCFYLNSMLSIRY